MEGAAFGGGGSQGNEGPCRLCLLSSLSNKSLDEGGSGQGMLKIVDIKVRAWSKLNRLNNEIESFLEADEEIFNLKMFFKSWATKI